MKTARIIRHGTGAFSSPVLLVKKKDNSWKFCVDYRALNQLIIKARFPITTVDELIDEMYCSNFSSKLDLILGYNQVRMQEENIPRTPFEPTKGTMSF